MTKLIKILSLILILIIIVSLTGCWDSKDINDKQIITTLVFDLKDGEIWSYYEIVNIEAGSQKGGSTSKKYNVIKDHAKTLPLVREKMNNKSDKPFYFSGVRAFVLTENFAKKYMVEFLYRMRNDEEARKSSITVITKDDPEKLFKNAEENSTSVGFLIEGMINSHEYFGKSFYRTTARLIEDLSGSYTGFLIPCIGINEECISTIGYSVVTDSTLTGFIPMEKSIGLIYLKADNPEFSFTIPYKNINFTILVKETGKDTNVSYKNNKVIYTVKLSFDCTLLYGDKKTPYDFTGKDNEEVSKLLKKVLEDEIYNAFKQAQEEYNSDYLQVDDEFDVHYPDMAHEIDWIKAFKNADLKYEIKLKLNSSMLDYSSDVIK